MYIQQRRFSGGLVAGGRRRTGIYNVFMVFSHNANGTAPAKNNLILQHKLEGKIPWYRVSHKKKIDLEFVAFFLI